MQTVISAAANKVAFAKLATMTASHFRSKQTAA